MIFKKDFQISFKINSKKVVDNMFTTCYNTNKLRNYRQGVKALQTH